jgi:hypothetical protein
VTSERQILANRRNATKSTGPRTAEGKAVVAQNATRHGLLSTRLLIEGEEEAELFGLADRLRAELRPVGELEELLFARIVTSCWRLRRVPHFEAVLLGRNDLVPVSPAQQFANYARETMTKVSRYEAQHERSLYKAMHELKRLQAARVDEAAAASPLLDGEAEPVEPAEDS